MLSWKRYPCGESPWVCKSCGMYEGTVVMEFPIGGSIALCRTCAEGMRATLKAVEKDYINDPNRVRVPRPGGEEGKP